MYPNHFILKTVEDPEKAYALLYQIKNTWAEFNQLTQNDSSLSTEWNQKIQDTNDNITTLKNWGVFALPRLSCLVNKASSALINSFVAFAHALITESDKLETMLNTHHEKLEDYYHADLNIIDAYKFLLYYYKEYLKQIVLLHLEAISATFQENLLKINRLMKRCNEMRWIVTNQKAARAFGVDLPLFMAFASSDTHSNQKLRDFIAKQHTILDQSLEIELVRLYCLTHRFKSKAFPNMICDQKSYQYITQQIHQCFAKITNISQENSFRGLQALAKANLLMQAWNNFTYSLPHQAYHTPEHHSSSHFIQNAVNINAQTVNLVIGGDSKIETFTKPSNR